ncbi:HVO_2922 family protein [Halomarina pelagica]|uniref:HVO_2922 family protein n=1 Tax=Halomarina pelagica TaxID=2961599 RepID=UPI0020C5597C|nr:HVO_2922 family protein [Halomarina sp. BND7]
MSTNSTFEVFRDAAGEWRWRLVASNGNVIADSGEGYRSKQGVERGIESVKRTAAEAPVEIVDED